MRIGRALTIPAIVTLGMAGSILAASATPVVAAQTAVVHVHALGTHVIPGVYYHA
jgi:hypothetical protein